MKHKKIYSNYTEKQIKNLIGHTFQGHIIIEVTGVSPTEICICFLYTLAGFPLKTHCI